MCLALLLMFMVAMPFKYDAALSQTLPSPPTYTPMHFCSHAYTYSKRLYTQMHVFLAQAQPHIHTVIVLEPKVHRRNDTHYSVLRGKVFEAECCTCALTESQTSHRATKEPQWPTATHNRQWHREYTATTIIRRLPTTPQTHTSAPIHMHAQRAYHSNSLFTVCMYEYAEAHAWTHLHGHTPTHPWTQKPGDILNQIQGISKSVAMNAANMLMHPQEATGSTKRKTQRRLIKEKKTTNQLKAPTKMRLEQTCLEEHI